MALVGFNFVKISGEKKTEAKGKISVKNNVVLKKVQKSNLNFSLGNDQGIEVEFGFNSIYSPEIGAIEISGKILLLEPKDKADEIVKEWDKSKKLPPLLMQQVFSTILRKCNIQAINMSEDLGLPSPIRLPDVQLKTKAEPKAQQPKAEQKTEHKTEQKKPVFKKF